MNKYGKGPRCRTVSIPTNHEPTTRQGDDVRGLLGAYGCFVDKELIANRRPISRKTLGKNAATAAVSLAIGPGDDKVATLKYRDCRLVLGTNGRRIHDEGRLDHCTSGGKDCGQDT